MIDPIETIPHTIIDRYGIESHLRIKQRRSKKKWVVRYIRPNPNWNRKDLPKEKRRFYIRTLQVESPTLAGVVPKLRKAFIIRGFTKQAGGKQLFNNSHLLKP